MATVILEHDTQTAHPAGDAAAELRELFTLDLSATLTITCASPHTVCSVKLICC